LDFILTADLKVGPKTDNWIGISSKTRTAISGSNSMNIPEEILIGYGIGRLEIIMAKKGYKLVRVGLVKIWFEKIEL